MPNVREFQKNLETNVTAVSFLIDQTVHYEFHNSQIFKYPHQIHFFFNISLTFIKLINFLNKFLKKMI